jgi:hypothetical protein
MLVDFERSGGFAGITLRTSIDTSKLSPADASQLEQMIRDSSFFNLPEQMNSPTGAADLFEYHLTISSPQPAHSVIVYQGAVPAGLQPLIDRLTDLARKRA